MRTVQLVAARTLERSAGAGDAASLDARVRTAIDRKVAAEWAEFLELSAPADLEDDQGRADLVAVLTVHGTIQQITDQAERTALAAFGRTDEADTEADRAYRTEQGRRWFRHNPSGEAAVAAATKAAATARDRVAQHLLTVRPGAAARAGHRRASVRAGRGRGVDGPAAAARRPRFPR
ncbi:hypothetical protein OG786_05175 [Streptomyces sp. NBC_00101]|uniref:hypothetical protein n=1 Tax=Streptomyces sp. NBC_00101 TaxID=2975651 RepID=UPI00325287B6